MKRTLLFLFLAVLSAVLMPVGAGAQVNPEAASGPTQAAPYKYEVYGALLIAGSGRCPFRSADCWVERFRWPAIVENISSSWGRGTITRWGPAIGGLPNPGDPSIYTFLVGPALHATLYGNLSGMVFGEIGGEHTGGEHMTPNISFAGGFGGGMAYSLSRRFAVQLTGDRVAASFSLPNNTPQLGNSTNRTWNARGTIGVVYRF